ncbi:hypothetical protein N7478_012565 [Penicillium angulare]|uniref:uncharacterized protein n=1 Tax=Penicillium angulare TaxID=116970 RepID=UPI0025424416|nr:uncharacterized protein N7478_012565 [Penicillium angulare]KAJ5259584.1 hypothetical protein N7478_012565 [Penicillium angulare]
MGSSPPNNQSLSGLSTSENPSSSARGPLAGGKQITRNRASYSCHTCRRRKVHPICSNCAKTGAECLYDNSSQKREDDRSATGRSGQGVKRRRETQQTWEEDVNELQSIYGHLAHDEAEAGQKPDPRTIEHRLEKLMSMVERLGGAKSSVEAINKSSATPNAAVESALLEDLRRPNSRNGRGPLSRPSSPRRNATESSGDEFPIPSGQEGDLIDPIGSLNLGHLSLQDNGRSRYVGTTYWAYISHEINDLNQLLKDQNRAPNQSPSDTTNDDSNDRMSTGPRSIDSPIPSTPSKPRGGSFQHSVIFPTGDSPSGTDRLVEPEMLEHVPTKRQSQILYKGFMSGIHAISPIIHPPTILTHYKEFWHWYDYSSYSGESCPCPSFVPLLYAIWYGGSVTISIRTIKAEFDASSRFTLSTLYSEEVTRWLTKISFPRNPSLQGLSAYLIVQTILSKEEEPLTSSLFVSLAMRVAQTMGLHRDPAKFGVEPSEAEYRRRLWWHIMHMDGVVAMSSGLPPLVSDENYWDVRETSEVKDTLLGSPAAERYEQMVTSKQRLPDNPDGPSVCGGPSMVNVFYLTARGKYIMARAVRRILRIQLGIKPVTRRDMEELRTILLDLQVKLNSIIKRIPDGNPEQTSGAINRASSMSKSPMEVPLKEGELPDEGQGGCAEQYHSPVLVSFHKWAKIILSLYIDKAFCVAYQPFLKNARSKIWPNARQSALRHCHGFMEKFIQLATDPDFQPFHWSWPGNHQPMHATMIMLIDLYERPYSPEASRSRAFIDRVLALSGPDGGVVGGEDGISLQRPLKDGGREAWDMIRRLRQKAWQKAGLNPRMLWTEQDQIQAGIASPAADLNGSKASLAGSPSVSTSSQPSIPDRQVNDFNRMFYTMTRSQIIPTSTTHTGAIKPSPLRHAQQSPAPRPRPTDPTDGKSNFASPSINSSSPEVVSSRDTPPSVNSSTSASASRSRAQHPRQPIPSTTNSPQMPFMDSIAPDLAPMGFPTPPSMVDPNLNFDWDQWDAVFGQHLPVSDELMELDSGSGLEFTNFGVPTFNLGNDLDATGMSTGDFLSGWAENPSTNENSTNEWNGHR